MARLKKTVPLILFEHSLEKSGRLMTPRTQARRRQKAREIDVVGSLVSPFLSVLFLHTMNGDSKSECLFMEAALEEARLAAMRGEVPVGAVVVMGGRIISRAGNRTIQDCDPTAHAEVLALRAAATVIGNYRLQGAALFVTIEPCAMCAGAMIQARVESLFYGADDLKGGAIRSCFAILDHPRINHRVDVHAGILGAEAAILLKDFFAARRH